MITDIAITGDTVDMATRIQKKAHPRRYTYNNSQWSQQLGFPYSGGMKVLGAFLIPPGHRMHSLRSSLTLIGKDTVDDDLQGSISSFIMSLPIDFDPAPADNEPGSFMLNSMSDLETWVTEKLPYVVIADEQGDVNNIYEQIHRVSHPAAATFKVGPGALILSGYGDNYDSANLLFSRTRKTHPIFGTGMMVGAQAVTSSVIDGVDSGNSAGGVYTPIDHSSTVIKKNVDAGRKPTIVFCIVSMPHNEDLTQFSDCFPDVDADSTTYQDWIDIHDPYRIDEMLNASDGNADVGAAQGAFKYLSVKYADENTDQGIPEDGSESKWNCTWKYSAQISPIRHPATPPRNVTVNNLYRS